MQLKNGLKTLFIESHKSPVVSIQAWVKTGSADEPEKLAGISHFIEHLVFKGTEKFKPGEIAAVVEGAGGELNAYTTFDQTVFYITISKEFADLALDVISQMMGFPKFDETEINNEREVVLEEIKRGEDNPRQRASRLLFKSVFKKHTYRRPIIGYDRVVKGVSAKNIRKYFFENYVPRNMYLVVAGDFETKAMKEKVTKYFSQLKDEKVKKLKRPKEPRQTQSRILVEGSTFNQNFLYLSWRIPNVKHKDVPALDVLSMILGQGDSSRLMRRLRIQEALATSCGSFAYTLQDDGLFAVSASYEKGKLEKIFAGIQIELNEMLLRGPSEEELQKAVVNFLAHEVYSLETVDSLSSKAGSNELYMNDHEYFKKYLNLIKKLTPMDIHKVAKKYLKKETLSISISSNEKIEENKNLAKIFLKSFEKSLNQKLSLKEKNNKAKKSEKSVEAHQTLKQLKSLKIQTFQTTQAIPLKKETLSSGGKILLQQQKGLPSVSVKLAFLGGIRLESDAAPGTAELFSRVWMSDTKKYKEQDLLHRLDLLSASLSPFSGKNSSGLEMEFLSPFEGQMQELFEEVLVHPEFSTSVLEREKQVLIHQIKSREDNPAQIAMLEFSKAMFKGHPYSKDPLGSVESISQMKTSDLVSFYKDLLKQKNFTMCVVGDVENQKWIDYAKKLNLQLNPGGSQKSNFKLDPIQEEIYIHKKLKKEQTHLVCGYRGITVTDPKRYTLDILQAVLAGQGGRLFIELRDKLSLAYTVAPIRLMGIETGYFGGYIACSPDKTKLALQKFKEEFQKIAQEKISPLELERAQRYLIGSHDIDLQKKNNLCQMILFDEIYGNNPEEGLQVSDRYYGVTIESVRDLAAELFSQPAVISVVGE